MYQRNINPIEDDQRITLLNLPVEILHNIFSILPYSEISHLREVCKKFNTTCQALLNHGFRKAQRLVPEHHREIKSKLPKRESQRQNHPLKLHAEVLSALDTRISLLDMTYTKCIEMNICCFIPGLVLDEIYRVVALLKTTTVIDRSHKVLKELRDLSSMAMEHFDEVVLPLRRNQVTLLQNKCHINNLLPFSDTIELFKSTTGSLFGKADCPNDDDGDYSVPESTPNSGFNVNNSETCYATILKIIDGILKNQKQLGVKHFQLQSLVNRQNNRIQHLESLLNLNNSNQSLCSQVSTTDAPSTDMRSTQSSSFTEYDSQTSDITSPPYKSVIDQDSEIPTKRRKIT